MKWSIRNFSDSINIAKSVLETKEVNFLYKEKKTKICDSKKRMKIWSENSESLEKLEVEKRYKVN